MRVFADLDFKYFHLSNPFRRPTVKYAVLLSGMILGTAFVCALSSRRFRNCVVNLKESIPQLFFRGQTFKNVVNQVNQEHQATDLVLSDQLDEAYKSSKTPETLERANAHPQDCKWGDYLSESFLNDLQRQLPTIDLKCQTEKVGEVVCTTTRGRRETNEDTVIMTTFSIGDDSYQFYAVNDGHGGDEASKFVEQNLPDQLQQALSDNNNGDEGIPKALEIAFLNVHKMFCDESKKEGGSVPKNTSLDTGTTVCGVLQRGKELWTANLGDTRAVVITPTNQLALSEDANPTSDFWSKRLDLSTTTTVIHGRIYDTQSRFNLAVAAAIGDENFAGMARTPDVSHYVAREEDLLLIACDGFWDTCSINDAGEAVRQLVNEKYSLQQIATTLVRAAYGREEIVRAKGPNIGDNITVMVVPMNPKRSSKSKPQ